jgi:hypothetical protein
MMTMTEPSASASTWIKTARRFMLASEAVELGGILKRVFAWSVRGERKEGRTQLRTIVAIWSYGDIFLSVRISGTLRYAL